MPITWKNVNDNFSSQINNLNRDATQQFDNAITGASAVTATGTGTFGSVIVDNMTIKVHQML